MSEEFRGTLKVEIDQKGLSAKILFTPLSSGEAQSLDTMKQALADAGVVSGISEEKLQEAAAEFSESMEPYLSDPVALGQPAQPGSGKTYDFAAFRYPSNLERVAASIKSKNSQPHVYRTIKVMVKKDKRVKDKGLFKSGRERIVTVEEEQEKKIRVDVSPEIREIGFFEQGDVICSVVTGSGDPKDGLNLKGEVLKAPEAVEGEFLPGKNIQAEKTEFIAAETGFVRKGENWIDLIPFQNHSWTLRVSDNKVDCYLDISPGHKAAAPPDIEDILSGLEKLSFSSEKLIDRVKIKREVQNACRGESARTICLTKDRDGSFDIELNSLNTEAHLHLNKGSGRGRPLNLKQAWAKVVALKIAGFEAERVKKEILDFNSSDEVDISIVLATGEDPRRGDDRELVLETEYLPDVEVEQIRSRIQSRKQMLPSFKDFPTENIEKMALVKKGLVLFHLGKQKGGKDGRDIFGNVIQGIEGNDPILNIYENIDIQDGVASSKIDGILDFQCSEMVYSLRVREHQDARIIVSIAENRMTAMVSVLSPMGSGSPVTKERLLSALEERGIVKGIQDDEIDSVCTLSSEGKIVTDQVVARGQLPFQGEKSLNFLVDLEPGRKDSVAVEQGELIAELGSLGDSSSAGFNVLGEELSNPDNKDIELEKNILQEEQDGKVLLKAGAKGLLCIENNRVYIKEKMSIRGDLSRTTGNLQFPGSIAVSGSVLSGIYVNAGKNLNVMEVVEAALLSAGGNITIGKGVKGDRKAVLRAGGSISLNFAESTNIMLNENLQIKKALMNCIVKCNGRIGSDSAGTRVIGGSLKVKHGLEAGILGSEREVKTQISFGQDYLVEDQINVVTREIEQINLQLPEIDSQLRIAESRKNQKKLMALRKKKVQMLKILEKKGIKNFFLKEKFEVHYDSEIIVKDTVYPGVVFESHGRTLEIKEKMTSVCIYFDSSTGKITTKAI